MTRDLTTGRPLTRILSFCGPLVIGNLFQQLYNLADSVIVGRLLGVTSFSAVGSTGAINFFVLGFAIGTSSGLTIPIAQSFGAGDGAGVRRRTGQVIWLAAVISLLMTLLCYALTDDILRITNTPEEIFDEAYRYIFIVFMGVSAVMLYNLTAGALRALGDSRTPLFFLIGAVLLNIVLDYFLIAIVGMGVEGAAYATVASQAVSGLGCLLYIVLRVQVLHIAVRDLKPVWREMGFIAGIGVPMGLQFSITAVGSIMIQTAVNVLGADAVAAMTAAIKVHCVVATPYDTVGVAMATYAGQNRGAGRIDRVRAGVRGIMLVCMAYWVFAFCVNYFFGVPIASLFIDSGEVAILDNVHRYLVACSLAYPLLAVVDVFRNTLQGLGFSRAAMLAGIAELVGRGAVAFGLTGVLGFLAICLADPSAWICADIVLFTLYFTRIRMLERTAESGPHAA